ncbi:hypothetical protein FQZ97_1119310 [compost metagenome]
MLQKILEMPFGARLDISKSQRMTALDHLIDFYRLNLDSFNGARSVQVLKEVLE